MNRGYKIKGLEEYSAYFVNDDIFGPTTSLYRSMQYYVPYQNCTYWLDTKNVFETKGSYAISSEIVTDREDLLSSAKTAYIHHASKIPRDLITSKFKKVLNPWLADIVVVPEAEFRSHWQTHIIFFDEGIKKMFIVKTNDNDTLKKFKDAEKGTKFRDFMDLSPEKWLATLNPDDSDYERDYAVWNVIFDSEFEFLGNVGCIDAKSEWLADVIDGNFPKDKIVFEKTVLKHLGNNDNKPTYENMMNIFEMINSKSEETQSLGLKALAMLDYIHYPHSVSLLFQNATSNYSQWKYCKGSNSSSVKFMFKQLFGGSTRNYCRYYSDTISQEDYDLFLQLLKAFSDSSDVYARTLANMPFMQMDEALSLHPNIAEAV